MAPELHGKHFDRLASAGLMDPNNPGHIDPRSPASPAISRVNSFDDPSLSEKERADLRFKTVKMNKARVHELF